MKKLFLFLSAIVLSLPGFAQTFFVGDIQYSVLDNNLKTCIASKGWDEFGYWEDRPTEAPANLIIPDEVTYENQTYKVTEIAAYGFRGDMSSLDKLRTVTIGNNVEIIGEGSFRDNSILESVTLGNNLRIIREFAFAYNDNLKGVIELPQTIEIIESNAFPDTGFIDLNLNITDLAAFLASPSLSSPESIWGNYEDTMFSMLNYSFQGKPLTQLIVPMGTKEIKKNAFRHCTTLQSVVLPDGIESIGDAAFKDCENLNVFSIPEQLTYLGESAFENCIALYEVNIPGTLEEIKAKTFKECHDLEIVTMGDGIKKIESDAFNNCYRITEINLPGSIRELGDNAFYACSKLTTINFPDNLEILGTRVFAGTHLKDVKLNNGLRIIGEGAFSSFQWEHKPPYEDAYWWNFNFDWNPSAENSGATSFTNLRLPQTVETIGEYAFAGCDIKTLILPDNIQTIGWGAFYGNPFTEIKIPSSITAISEGMFIGCSNLKSIEFSGTINSIDDYAFALSGLRMLEIPSPVVSIGERAFAKSGIINISFPETLTSIGARAFENTAMVSYEIPNSVTSIGENAFGSLHYLKMGTGFNDFTVRFCEGTEVLEMVSATPPTLTADRLGFTPSMVLVPEKAGEAYLSNNRWKEYNIVARNSKTAVVYLNESGTLASEIRTQTGLMPGAVTNLIVEGAALNDDDFAIIRSNMPACYEIDMSGVANTSIPQGVFNGKTGLLSISLPRSLKEIGDNAFENCYTAKFSIPETVERIGANAFANCQSMDNELKFANTLKSIGSNAFNGCRSLKSVDLSALEDVSWGGNNDDDWWWGYYDGQGVFGNCYALSEVKFPSKLSSIPPYMFYGSNLEKLVIPATTQIGEYAFSNCPNLRQVAFEDGFNGLGNNAFSNCTGLYAVVMPESVTRIGSETFRGCTSLQNIGLPESLFEIGYAAFYGSGLNYIVIPAAVKLIPTDCFTQSEIVAATIDGATEIDSNAFGNCPNLLVVNLPSTLQTLNGASLNSPSLSAITSPSVRPAATNDNPFDDVSSVTCALAVPKPSFTPYLMAEFWGKFVSIRNSIDVSQVNYDDAGEEISDEENAEDPASELTYMDEEDYQDMLEDMEQEEEENGEEPEQARRRALRVLRANGLAGVNKGYGKLFNNASLFLDEKASTRFFIALADDVTSFTVMYNNRDITSQVDLNTMSFVIDGLTSSSSLVVITNGHTVETGDNSGVDTIGGYGFGDDEDAPYYNLNGQVVKNPTPGIYIHNGRKVVIR